jgi:flagellar FliL protein
MAKDAKAVEEGAEAPKKSKKLLIIIVAAVLVLVLAGGGAFMLLKKTDHAEDGEDATEETAKPKKKDKKADAAPPVFVNLDTFTVNLIPETGDQYLQVVLALELEDATADAALKAQMPKVRNNIMLLLKIEINSIIEPSKKNKKGEKVLAEGPIKSVLFTSFIIQ